MKPLTDDDQTRRIPAAAGFVDDLSALPRGPSGRPLCRHCGEETKPPRQTFCSDACVHEWKLRTQPAYQARHVLERDAGVCALCSLDCVATLAALRELRQECRGQAYGHRTRVTHEHWDGNEKLARFVARGDERLDRFAARCSEIGLPKHLRFLDRRLWEMDHTVPVVEGGGSCGLDNLRTLCWRCHKSVTAELRKRRTKGAKR